MQVVERAWHCPLQEVNPFHRLDWLFRNTVPALKSWSDRFVGNICIQLEVAKAVVAQLE
jgi:hypothetical protein